MTDRPTLRRLTRALPATLLALALGIGATQAPPAFANEDGSQAPAGWGVVAGKQESSGGTVGWGVVGSTASSGAPDSSASLGDAQQNASALHESASGTGSITAVAANNADGSAASEQAPSATDPDDSAELGRASGAASAEDGAVASSPVGVHAGSTTSASGAASDASQARDSGDLIAVTTSEADVLNQVVRAIAGNPGGDLIWFGTDALLSGNTVGGDILAAGRSLTVRGATVDGSVRAAGQHIIIEGSAIGRNVTAAGQMLTFGSGSTARSVYLAGQDISFAGHAETLCVAAQSVRITGEVDGGVTVWADSVVVGSNARITGTLTVHGSTQPQIADGASIGSVEVVGASVGESSGAGQAVLGYALGVLGTAVSAVLLALVMPGAVCGAARMTRTRPAALAAGGLLGLVALVPMAVALALALGAAGLAGALVAATIALALVSVPLTGTALCGALIPARNRFATAALGGLAWGLLAVLPWTALAVGAVSLVFALGYVVQTAWLGIRHARGMQAGGDHPAPDGAARVELPHDGHADAA